jgi:hypothetical protein
MTDDQMTMEGMPEPQEPPQPTRIVFTGARADSLADVFKMGAHHEFKVSGEVVHLGPKKKKDGTIYQLVQIDVEDIEPLSYEEPET